MKNFLVFFISLFLGAAMAFTIEANSIMRVVYSSENTSSFLLGICSWVSFGFILAYFGQWTVFSFQSKKEEFSKSFFLLIFVFLVGVPICFFVESENVGVLFAEKVGRLSYLIRTFGWFCYGAALYHFGSQLRFPKIFAKRKTHFLKRAL